MASDRPQKQKANGVNHRLRFINVRELLGLLSLEFLFDLLDIDPFSHWLKVLILQVGSSAGCFSLILAVLSLQTGN